jgi:secreted trypsin-like serine protease
MNHCSGGPIQIAHTDASCVYDIVGLTSYGPFKCGTKTPAVYTRVTSYLDWIEAEVWP